MTLNAEYDNLTPIYRWEIPPPILILSKIPMRVQTALGKPNLQKLIDIVLHEWDKDSDIPDICIDILLTTHYSLFHGLKYETREMPMEMVYRLMPEMISHDVNMYPELLDVLCMFLGALWTVNYDGKQKRKQIL